jgi:hypothetical protein
MPTPTPKPQSHHITTSHHKTTTVKTQSGEQTTVSKKRATITCVKPPSEKSLAQNPHSYKCHNSFTKTTGNRNEPTTEINNKPTTENETQ